MAQAQAVRTSTKELTQTQSVALIKNLVRASISEVCFIRNLFPSDLFKSTAFGSTTVRVLCPKDTDGQVLDEAAQLLKLSEEAAFEALEKGYLKSIVMGIYTAEKDPEERTLLESYVFTIKYPTKDEVELMIEKDGTKCSTARVRDEAVTTIRTLIRLTETIAPVPEDRVLSLKLFYYDDRTPPDYQPSLFHDATFEQHAYFDGEPSKYMVGNVTSKFHSMSVKVAFKEEEEPSGVGLDESIDISEGNQGPVESHPESSQVVVDSGIEEDYATNLNSKTGAVHAVELIEGVDPMIYQVARNLLLQNRAAVCTLRGMISHLRKENDAFGYPIDVSSEQARRLLRQFEIEGLVMRKSGANKIAAQRFEPCDDAIDAQLKLQAEGARQLQGNYETEQNEALEYHDNESAHEAQQQTDVDEIRQTAESQSELWYALAVLSVIGRAGEGLGGTRHPSHEESAPVIRSHMKKSTIARMKKIGQIKAVAATAAREDYVPPYKLRTCIRSADLREDIPELDTATCRRVLLALEKDGILTPPLKNGREVIASHSAVQLYRKAREHLIGLGMELPAHALPQDPPEFYKDYFNADDNDQTEETENDTEGSMEVQGEEFTKDKLSPTSKTNVGTNVQAAKNGILVHQQISNEPQSPIGDLNSTTRKNTKKRVRYADESGQQLEYNDSPSLNSKSIRSDQLITPPPPGQGEEEGHARRSRRRTELHNEKNEGEERTVSAANSNSASISAGSWGSRKSIWQKKTASQPGAHRSDDISTRHSSSSGHFIDNSDQNDHSPWSF